MNDSEAREMARGLVRGSIIEDAASQFIAQVLKEAHDSRIKPLRDRIEELEAKLAKAVEHFKKLRRRQDCLETYDAVVDEVVETALAELTGGKDA